MTLQQGRVDKDNRLRQGRDAANSYVLWPAHRGRGDVGLTLFTATAVASTHCRGQQRRAPPAVYAENPIDQPYVLLLDKPTSALDVGGRV